jgi:hypothetical protein
VGEGASDVRREHLGSCCCRHIRSKSDTGQINEALCKILAHNICVLIRAMRAFNLHPVFYAEHASL